MFQDTVLCIALVSSEIEEYNLGADYIKQS